MGLFDFLHLGTRGSKGAPSDTAGGMGADDDFLEEPGDGGPSLFAADLARLRWVAQQEAVNVGRLSLEPELWEGGRLRFEFERTLAHEHEGLRDRLADYVAATSRDHLAELHSIAGNVAVARDDLRVADRELATVLYSWNSAYREVHEDELELGRYFRLKSKMYQLFKLLVALCFFGAELAVSTALFGKVVSADNPAYPLLFSLGLILMLIMIPHYSAIGLKDGLTKYHEAEMDAHARLNLQAPSRLRKKARVEEIEDAGMKLAAGVVGLALVGMLIPLSALRARELGSPSQGTFWFVFFLLLQTAISGYFFLREWMDYGTASVNLKHHDESKDAAEATRESAVYGHATLVASFLSEAEQLRFLFREAPRWDSHIVQTYLATIHYFRHLVTLQQPDLSVFINHAAMPYLGRKEDATGSDYPLDPVGNEHLELERADAFGREWWLRQLGSALVMDNPNKPNEPSSRARTSAATAARGVAPATVLTEAGNRPDIGALTMKNPEVMLYTRPSVLNKVEEIREKSEPTAAETTSAESLHSIPSGPPGNGVIGTTDAADVIALPGAVAKKVDPLLQHPAKRRV
jgi:hypothetical protein